MGGKRGIGFQKFLKGRPDSGIHGTVYVLTEEFIKLIIRLVYWIRVVSFGHKHRSGGLVIRFPYTRNCVRFSVRQKFLGPVGGNIGRYIKKGRLRMRAAALIMR